MASTLRYGIVGTGMMGLEHALNIRLLEDAQVTAIADPHPRSRGWGVDTAGPEVKIFENHRELLADDSVDAVVIASPNHTHVGILEDALRTPVARLIEEVRAGTAGRLRMLAIREHRFPFLPKVGDWNRFARNTGGTLVEKCCHFFDLMNLITQARPLRVYASGAQDVNHLDERYEGEVPDILDNAFVVVDFEGGCRGLLDLCMFAEASRNEQEIAATGDEGKIECFVPDCDVIIGRRKPREVESVRVPVEERLLKAGFHHGSTYYEHVAFGAAVRSGRPSEVSLADGLLAVAVGQAAELSAQEGRPVELSELGVS
jgi:predicted dehydrogenase